MSMLGGRVPPGRENVGETVAAYPTYESAQKAVSALIAAEVPARDIAIVGQGLRSIERVTGRLGYATAARSGAVNGLLLGLLFSFVFVLGMPTAQISVFLGVLLVGVAVGMLLSLVTYSIVRRRRDFASVMQVAADHYEVCVAPTSIGKARQTLGSAAFAAGAPGAAAPVPPRPVAPTDDRPPQYGERVAPPTGDAQPPAAAAPDPDAAPTDRADAEETAGDVEEPPRYGERAHG
ncbi:general stress protein [Microbacterium sp. 10M-3C3]|jgi:hypothetical protein|uniref:general stress protein n=1 Tax=Microbacterium sp. 10M-3C3 TaxID=2483401 RepID=UPI000F63DD10|nr:general stress protein [Microbacterium sp. 10M-3C3]